MAQGPNESVEGAIKALSALYGEGSPGAGQAAAMMRDIANTLQAPSGGMLGYTDARGKHATVVQGHVDKDGSVGSTVAKSGDHTVTGRNVLAEQLANYQAQMKAAASVSDTRFGPTAVLDAANHALGNATKQVNTDVDNARKQASAIVPPATPTRRRRRVSSRSGRGRASLSRRRRGRGRMISSDGTKGGNAVSAASGVLGLPYIWGGGGAGGPSGGGFDCSGLTQYAIAQASGGEVVLPRTTYDQINSGVRVPMSEVRAGDLVFPGESWSGRGPEHVQLAAGGGRVIEAPHSGSTVKWSNMPSNAIIIRVL